MAEVTARDVRASKLGTLLLLAIGVLTWVGLGILAGTSRSSQRP